MPTYSYQCSACQFTFEVNHPAAETVALSCPKCGGLTRKQLPQKLTVIHRNPEPDPEAGHICGPTCALHYKISFWTQKPPPTEA